MTRIGNRRWITLVSVALVLGLAFPAAAERKIRQRSGWVPQAAWDAVKVRAGLDIGSTRIKLYKSGWSRALSRGLKGNLGSQSKAYVVHARGIGNHPVKSKGNYLAVKSDQGHYEVFPLALTANAQGRAARGKHITKVDSRRAINNTYAFSDGYMPASKVVQAVKASATRLATAHEGQIVASKQRGRTKTFFLLGNPNRQANNPAATGRVSLYANPLVMNQAGSGYAPMNTKFIDMPKPAIAPIMPPIARPLAAAAQ